jgi:hypothetical protein
MLDLCSVPPYPSHWVGLDRRFDQGCESMRMIDLWPPETIVQIQRVVSDPVQGRVPPYISLIEAITSARLCARYMLRCAS